MEADFAVTFCGHRCVRASCAWASCQSLTEQTGLAVGTVRRAVNILVKEGLAQTVPGRGTFVT